MLKRAVLEIRKALGDPVEEPRFIQTLHRRGYRFLTAGTQPQTAAEPRTAVDGIVGRDQELDQLDSWFQDAVESRRQMVFIPGEAGLGKSTLVEAWMRTLGSSATAARGRCLQQFGSGEPYLPVFEALDQLSQTLGRRLVEYLRARAPTWLLHMPALISLEERVKLGDEVFGSTRERMLREIADALEAVCGETPLVLVLEDLHWSDPSTVDLLSAIARRSSPARLMILATYRPSEAGGNSGPLLAVQNELELHRQCRVLPLGYLSEDATGDYLSSRFPGMDSPELAAALHRRTNGNPLYVSCLADELERSKKAGADPDAIRGMVPETLQQMFERQAAQLSPSEQEMLDCAAAAGEMFAVSSVAAALGRDAADLETQCEQLVSRHMILKRGDLVRFPDGAESAGYAFVHALCRDALYRRIPPGRRSRLHSRLGQAEEQLYAADLKRVAAQLAGHFELAGALPRAIEYLRLAAEGAAARCSLHEATQYLERAFSMVDRLAETDRASSHMDLLAQRARMRMTASDMRGSTADYRALADLARQAGDVGRATHASLESLAPLLYIDHQQVMPALDEAAQYAPDDPLSHALIDLYRALLEMYFSGWSQQNADLLHAALPTIERTGDLHLRCRAAWAHAAELTFSGQYAAACDEAEKARQYARRAGVFYDYFVAAMYLQWALVERGDLGQALRVARDGAEMANRNGSPISQVWFAVREAWVHLEAFDFERTLETYEKIAQHPVAAATNSRPLYLWLGRARFANRDYEGAWRVWEYIQQALESSAISFQVWCPLLQSQAECKMEMKDLSAAETIAQRLVREAALHHEFSYVASGHRLLAEIAGQRNEYQAAAGQIAKALAALERCESWTVEWRVHATAAFIFARLGQSSEAEQSRERSLEAAGSVAATLAGEPDLQQSFLARVQRDLAAVRANTA